MPAETTVAAKTAVAGEATVDATLGEGRHHGQRGQERRNQDQATHVYILRR
jgi:hypothetical protein